MSAQLTGLIRCGFSAAATMLLTASSTVAEPIYTVTDQGISSDILLSSDDRSPDVTTRRRLTLDSAGKVTVGTWEKPGSYSGPLPDALRPGGSAGTAVVTSRAGDNAAGWGFDKDRAWAGFADLDGRATATGNLPGRTWSQALGVNQQGQVVGVSGGGTNSPATSSLPPSAADTGGATAPAVSNGSPGAIAPAASGGSNVPAGASLPAVSSPSGGSNIPAGASPSTQLSFGAGSNLAAVSGGAGGATVPALSSGSGVSNAAVGSNISALSSASGGVSLPAASGGSGGANLTTSPTASAVSSVPAVSNASSGPNVAAQSVASGGSTVPAVSGASSGANLTTSANPAMSGAPSVANLTTSANPSVGSTVPAVSGASNVANLTSPSNASVGSTVSAVSSGVNLAAPSNATVGSTVPAVSNSSSGANVSAGSTVSPASNASGGGNAAAGSTASVGSNVAAGSTVPAVAGVTAGSTAPAVANNQAFLYTRDEGIKGLGTADTGSAAYAINNSGQLVGELAKASDSPGRAFTSFNDGPLVNLNRLIDPTSGWNLTRATDINNLGQIAAFGLDSLDVMHAVLLTPTAPVDASRLVEAAGSDEVLANSLTSGRVIPQPVPEPSVLALFGLVTVGLAAGRGIRHRRSR